MTGQPPRPIHLGSSRHPVAAEAVAELVVQLLESIGFAPPPDVLHLAICGTHALHAEAIVAAVGKLIRPRVVTAELHESEFSDTTQASATGLVCALGLSQGTATAIESVALSAILGPAAADSSPTTASASSLAAVADAGCEVQFSGASLPEGDGSTRMHWHADRLLQWSENAGTVNISELHVQLDPARIAWVPGPRVDQELAGRSLLWSRPLRPTWRGAALSALDGRPASALATECLDSLLEALAEQTITDAEADGAPDQLQVVAPGGASSDAPSDARTAKPRDEPADLSLWVVWPNHDLPAPFGRLASLARVESVNHVSGALRLRPVRAFDRTEPIRLLAVSGGGRRSGSIAGVSAFAVSDRVATHASELLDAVDEVSTPWPVHELLVSVGDRPPVPIAGARWCLCPVDGSRTLRVTE